MAKTPRTWTGARTPSGLKRVRQAQSRREVLQPRRSAAKTYVSKALAVAAAPGDSDIDPNVALIEALSALDRAAKAGAIHPNAAARRKSRLTRKVNAALSGTQLQAGGHVTKSTGKLAAQKAAKARIAAGKAGKAKGAQTAAGKARAALEQDHPCRGGRREGRRGERGRGGDAGQGHRHEDDRREERVGEGRREGDRDQGGSEEGRRDDREGGPQGDREGGPESQEGRGREVGGESPVQDDAPVTDRGV